MKSEGVDPLRNPRHEAFCQARAAGAGLGAAYTAATPPGKPKPASPGSAKSMGHTLTQREDVAARIQYLLAKRRAAVLSSLDLTTIEGLADAARYLGEMLDRLADRLLEEGAESSALAALRSTQSAHASRSISIGKSVRGDAVRPPSGGTLQPILMPAHDCDCDAGDG